MAILDMEILMLKYLFLDRSQVLIKILNNMFLRLKITNINGRF